MARVDRRGGAYTRRMTEPKTSSQTRPLLWIGIATCWFAEFPVWKELLQDPSRMAQPRSVAWMAGFFIFLAAFTVTALAPPGRKTRWHLVLLALQSLTALALGWLLPNPMGSVLPVIVAAQLPGYLPLGPSLAWVALQTAVLAIPLVPAIGVVMAILVSGVYLGFQLFALYTFRIAQSERQARAELARTHEALLATRQLLAESTRAAERLRIARELHDVLGHHLTALSLNLEAALHAPGETSREHVTTAQRLAKGLLQEVREVVSTLRQDEPPIPPDPAVALEGRLAAALAELGAGLDEPLVHLTVRPEVRLDSPDLAHTVLRWTQEIFTNAVRHAGARNLWLEVSDGGGGLTLRARDDGRGAAEIVPGNGLQGMRERLERLGGRLDLESAPGHGFEVTAWLPGPVEGAA
jgi:signal transduction histidine kinase